MHPKSCPALTTFRPNCAFSPHALFTNLLTYSHQTYTRTSAMAYPTIGTAGKELSMANFLP
eukprot:scaffold346982_cov156-Cyclotella_meneghiniana.AAC.1